jgi:predicted permease
MLRLLLELLPCLSLGVLIGRRRPGWIRPLSLPLVHYGVPISLMGLLLRGGLSWSLLGYAGVAVAGILLMLPLCHRFAPLRRWIGSPALELGACVGNTAYFGIPVALALLPAEALKVSIGYDVGATLLAWALGPFWLARGCSVPGEHQLRALGRHVSESPASRGLLGALLVHWTPWQQAVSDWLWWPARVVIVLALVVVGMRLGAIDPGQASASGPEGSRLALQGTVVAKLLVYPVLVLLLTSLLPLDTTARHALVLQAAAPTAISVLLMAETQQRDHHAAALVVLRSTALALVTVPLWWWVLQNGLPWQG